MHTSLSRALFSVFILSLSFGGIALAAEEPLSITNVNFSADYDTATVTLSRDPGTKTSLQSRIYRDTDNAVVSNMVALQSGRILTMSGFRSKLDIGGEGAYRIDFVPCPESMHFTSADARTGCGPTYTFSLLYTLSDEPVSISSVSFSADYDTATITLSHDPGTKTSLEYDLYKGNEMNKRRDGGTLQSGRVIQLSGFRYSFDIEGYGTYVIKFAACPEETHFSGSGIRSDCGPIYTSTLQYSGQEEDRVICGISFPEGGRQCEENMRLSECQAKNGMTFISTQACWGYSSTGTWGDFPVTASRISANSAVLSTTRSAQANEYYNASCSPYTGYEESDGFTKSTSIMVNNLKPNTKYICRMYVFPSASGGNTNGRSADVVFTTTSSSSYSSSSSSFSSSSSWSSSSSGRLPPAGYEDEVLTNFDAYANPFPDTNLFNLSGKAAAELYRRAIIGGFPDGEFKGSRPVNRAEAAKFLLLSRFPSVDEVSNNGRFPDVLDSQWYTKYVVTAAAKGIINGYPDGFFRPADQVNTAEFLKMLSLTFGLQLNMSHRFNDVPAGSWFEPYAGIAQSYNLFPNRSTSLFPGNALSREEVAVAIYQYLSNR